ncbi:MAG: hypothetical protein MUO97_08170 [Dehalococcoidia bacterium]|nr:hypothetical protein [Dehalococcoidia bacterium]
MNDLKNRLLLVIAANSVRKTKQLANQFAHAKPEEREAIQAGLEFKRWLAETCQECMDYPQKC